MRTPTCSVRVAIRAARGCKPRHCRPKQLAASLSGVAEDGFKTPADSTCPKGRLNSSSTEDARATRCPLSGIPSRNARRSVQRKSAGPARLWKRTRASVCRVSPLRRTKIAPHSLRLRGYSVVRPEGFEPSPNPRNDLYSGRDSRNYGAD